MNVYFNEEETAFIKSQGKGYLRGLVQQAMAGGASSGDDVQQPVRPRQTAAYGVGTCKTCNSQLPYHGAKSCKVCGSKQ